MPTYDQPTPNPINCWIGRGSVFVGLYNGNGDFTGLHHIGNAKGLRTQPQVEYVTLPGFTTPGAGIVAKEEIAKRVTGSIQLYELEYRNLALLAGGVARTYSQSSQVVSGEPLTTSALRGAYYSTQYRNITNLVLTQGSTTLAPSDWSLVNASAGLIKLLTTGSATNSAPLSASYVAGAITEQKVVDLYAAGAKSGQIVYISANPVLAQGELRLHHVCLEAGALENLLDDDFFSSTLGFELMDDSAGRFGGSPDSPYGRWWFPQTSGNSESTVDVNGWVIVRDSGLTSLGSCPPTSPDSALCGAYPEYGFPTGLTVWAAYHGPIGGANAQFFGRYNLTPYTAPNHDYTVRFYVRQIPGSSVSFYGVRVGNGTTSSAVESSVSDWGYVDRSFTTDDSGILYAEVGGFAMQPPDANITGVQFVALYDAEAAAGPEDTAGLDETAPAAPGALLHVAIPVAGG